MKLPNPLQVIYHSIIRVYEHSFKKNGGQTQIDRKTGDEYIPKPENVTNIKYSEDIKPEEKGIMDAKIIQRSDLAIYTDIPDVVAEPEPTHPKPKVLTYPQVGEDSGWKYAYYPAGGRTNRRPDMDAIRTWVENTKVGTASNFTISEEFGKEFGYIGFNLSPDKKKKEIDKKAYLIARKLWYVGRRPITMSDDVWQKETKDMRPPEGSFNYRGEEKWNNFKYDETYKYETGKVHE
jgi:hypothetical protein